MAYFVLKHTQGTGAQSGQSGQPHQYWRLIATGNVSTIVVPEIEFAETPGGPDVTTSIASDAISSSNIPNGPPSGAFDDYATLHRYQYWEPTSYTVGQWIGINFASIGSKDIKEVRIYQNSTYPLPDFTLEYSDDGVNWTPTAITLTGYTNGWNTFN